MISPDNIEAMVRRNIKALAGYVPIEPTDVLSRRIKIATEDIIKLDGNENPYGCSAKAKKALAGYSLYHIYPDPEQRELRKALEQYTGFSSQHILAGAGSDELIDLVLRLFIEPGDRVINCPPTFGMYKFCTEVCSGELVNINRKEDFSIDIPGIKKSVDKKTKVIFIASPNNPSANLTGRKEILELLQMPVLVVVDEAYFEFSNTTVSSLILEYSNLVVLRTFSKWAGLAGLRVGYGIFPDYLMPYLMKIKQPYNINIAAQIAAIESLKDINYLRGTVRSIISERKKLLEKLRRIEWLKVYPSRANFILCSLPRGKAKVIHQRLQRKGIFVRFFDSPQLKDYLRISIGKPEQNDRLIAALREACTG
jgi:histidinol-phosphate aminotransferase